MTHNKIEKNKRFFCPSPFLKSRKGEVPVMILVIGVFVLVTLAILSFYFINNKYKEELKGVGVVESANSRIDQYYLYKKLGFNREEIKEALILSENQGNLYLDFSINDKGKEYSVRYTFLD